MITIYRRRAVWVWLCVLLLLSGTTTAQSAAETAPLSGTSFIHAFGELANSRYRIRHRQPMTVAFLGGSITDMKGWRNLVCSYLQQRYPQTQFTFIAAGIPSLGSLPHAFRLQQDVLDKGRVDLLFVEAAVNDRGTDTLTQRRALEGIVQHARKANAAMDIVFMAFVDEYKIAEYKAGRTPFEVQVHEDIARQYHLPFINLAAEITRRIDHKEFSWEKDFVSLHPSPFGHQLYFNTIRSLLDTQFAAKALPAIVRYALPAPADRFCYANGHYVPVTAAVQLQHCTQDTSWQPSDAAHTRPALYTCPCW